MFGRKRTVEELEREAAEALAALVESDTADWFNGPNGSGGPASAHTRHLAGKWARADHRAREARKARGES